MMMRIVIVDDDRVFSEKVEGIIRDFFTGIEEDVCVRRYGEGYTLLDELTGKRNYDIYFLDVVMPGINGLVLAQRIKAMEGDARIVFLSAYEKYALSSYKIQVCYYILKQEYKKELPVILERIWGEIQQERTKRLESCYVIQNHIWGKKIWFDDILYLTKEKKYTVFHCMDGKEYKERAALGEVYGKMPHEGFIYVNRGHVINMKYVSGWEGDVIRLCSSTGDMELSVSRRMAPMVKEYLGRYWRKEGRMF